MIALGGFGNLIIQILGIYRKKIEEFDIIKEGLTAPLINLDWSENSSMLMVNTLGLFLI